MLEFWKKKNEATHQKVRLKKLLKVLGKNIFINGR